MQTAHKVHALKPWSKSITTASCDPSLVRITNRRRRLAHCSICRPCRLGRLGNPRMRPFGRIHRRQTHTRSQRMPPSLSLACSRYHRRYCPSCRIFRHRRNLQHSGCIPPSCRSQGPPHLRIVPWPGKPRQETLDHMAARRRWKMRRCSSLKMSRPMKCWC
jgi:hypothetical protein